MVKLWNTFKDNPDFQFVSIGFGQEMGPYNTAEKMEAFVKKNKMDWRHTWAFRGVDQSTYARIFGMKGVPYIILIDQEGKIILVQTHGDELTEAIEKALKKK